MSKPEVDLDALVAGETPLSKPVAMESDRFGFLFVAMDCGRVLKFNTGDRNGEWVALPPLPGTEAAEQEGA